MRHVVEQFEVSWLAHYPRPIRFVHNNGTEFIGIRFREMLVQYGIKDVSTTERNPQSNAICKRIHQKIRDILRVTLHTNPPINMNDANQFIDNALETCMHAMRCSVNATLDTSPGALVYDRDMIMDVLLIANQATIRDRRQHLINKNLFKQNKKRT